ncbi:hypothetical protein [Vibrio tapetis]|uniref:Uncharacterized protein n=1 Tax=Vibrio tapetis subsp. tapetis TaxID=1671868 RepID=A0A2N8ZNC2_9VIBR|nr:hypothetical protein [Vibrio tapetis]SON53418.1 conserved protein of unknown function [Vibrio tapetis subsp. tapetis]
MIIDHYPEFYYEEEYRGYTLYVENNPDQYNEGYEYSISDGTSILEQGLTFDAQEAIKSAQIFVDSLVKSSS